MSDAAMAKVEDKIRDTLSAYPALSGWTILADESRDIALEEGTDNTLQIYTVSYGFNVADENWMTLHTATVEIESVNQTPALGTINRANHTALAHVLAALAADRSLGGMLQDLQEIDLAPAGANGKDVAGASLQIQVQFFTPRGDHFTIAGVGGQTF